MGAVLTPDSGAPVLPGDPIVFDVTDADETLTSLLISLRHDTGIVELVHDGTDFTAFYAGSARTPITDGYHFSLVRVGGWSDANVSISAYPFAGSGVGLIDFSSDFEVLSNPPGEDVALSVTGVTAGTYGDATHVGQFATDTKGRITAAASITIAIPASAITDSTAAGRAVLTAANASAQRTTLGLVIGTDVQAQDAELAAIAGLTSAANKVPYFTGAGTAAVADLTAAGRALIDDADATAQRATLGLVIGTDVQAHDVELDALASVTSAADRVPYFTGSGTATVTPLTAAGRALIDDADTTAQRVTLGLVVGTDVQAYDAELDALSSVTSAANKVPYFTGAGTATVADLSAAGRALIDDADASAQRTTLGLVIGTDVQAHDVELDALASVTSAANKLPYFTGSGTATVADLTAAGRALIDDADASAQRATLGLVIGTDVQAQDAELASIAVLTSAANKLPYFTGPGTAALADLTVAGRALIDDADASAQRATLGLVIGTDVQAHDVELDALASVTSAANKLPYFTGSGTAAVTDLTAAGRALIDDADATAQRATLGLVIGTDVQAQDAELAAIAGLTSAANKLPYFTGSGTAALADLTVAGRALIDDADASAQRTTLGLVIGTDVQAHDVELDALASVTSAADRVPYFTGSGTATVTPLTAAGRALIDDADATAQRATLGLGTMATQAASAVAITGGTITGMSSPSGSSDVATKGYVDALAGGGASWKLPVRVAIDTNVNVSSGLVNGATGDGVTLATGDRVLLFGQTAPAENGIYITAASGAASRAGDADAASELLAAAMFATEGTSYHDKAFICTTDAPITLGSTALTFVNFGSFTGGLLAANNLSDLTSVSTARTNLGLVIGTDVQAHDVELDALASVTSAANKLPYFTGSGTAAVTDLTAAGRALIDDADATAQRATLGLVIGTDVQAQDAELAAIAGLTSAANKLPYFTGSGTAALADLTVAGRALIDDADASAQRTTLGLVIGTDVQAHDVELDALASVTSAANKLPYFTGSGTATVADLTAAGRALIDDADASAQRTTLGLVIGTDVQAQDAELAAIAGLTSAANKLPYFTGAGTAALADLTVAGRALIDDADASAQRTTLGLAIGTDVQAHDVELDALASVTSAADRVPYFTGSGTATVTPLTAAGRALIDDADATAQRATLGLVIGTDVQAHDVELDALASVTSAANKLPYFTGSGTATVADLTAAGRALIDDADASAQRTTLGLGTMATQAASAVAITGGTITGITDLAIADGGTGASSAVAAKDALSTKSSNIASASTTDLSTATGDLVHVTGTTTITALGTCAAGVERVVIFDGVLALTHNATSLILPGAASINTAAGDAALFRSEGSGNWRCVGYIRAALAPFGGSTVLAGTTLTLSLSALAGDDVVVSGFADAVLINCPTSGYSICNGLAGGVDGKIIFLHNTSAFGTGPLQLTAEATSSAAANRFSTNNGTFYLYGKDACMLRYSGQNQRWEALTYPGQYSRIDNTTSPWGLLNGGGAIQFADVSTPGAFSPTQSIAGCSPCNISIDAYYDSLLLCGIKTNRRLQQALGTATASANDLTLPGWVFGNPSSTSCAGAGNTYHITGTTTINRILAGNSAAGGWQAGSKITLIFDGVLTLTDAAASGSNFYGFWLKGGTDRATVANTSLSFTFDGSYWVEDT